MFGKFFKSGEGNFEKGISDTTKQVVKTVSDQTTKQVIDTNKAIIDQFYGKSDQQKLQASQTSAVDSSANNSEQNTDQAKLSEAREKLKVHTQTYGNQFTLDTSVESGMARQQKEREQQERERKNQEEDQERKKQEEAQGRSAPPVVHGRSRMGSKKAKPDMGLTMGQLKTETFRGASG
jgi:hypothetical protein